MAITINVNLDEILQALKDDLAFAGNADKYIKVNATADGFEFAAVSGGGVTTLEGLSGAINLVAGTNVTITDNGTDSITISSTAAVSDGDKGDITVSASGATWTIDNNAVTTAKIADANVTFAKIENISTSHFLGRHTGGSGSVQQVSASQARSILNVEDGAEVNNISDANATDLTDGGDSTLHYHSSDRDRANHTGTQLLSTISDVTASAAEVNILDGATLTTTELNYVDGVTSGIQTQLDGKASLSGATFTGAVNVNANLAVDTDTLFVDSANNRVGVGTSSPSVKFEIKDPSSTDAFQFSPNTNSGVLEYAGGSLRITGASVYNPTIEFNVATGISLRRRGSTEWLNIAAATGNVGINNTSPSAMLDIVSNATDKIGQIIQAAAGQTANLQEWRDSSSTNRMWVTPSGDNIGFNVNGATITLGTYFSLFQISSSSSFRSLLATGFGSYEFRPSTGNAYSLYASPTGAYVGNGTKLASSILQLNSTTQGFLPPVMTGAQVEAISSPAEGLIEYATDSGSTDVTSKGLYVYDGSNFGKLITSINGNVNLTSPTTSSIPLSVQAAAGQTANLLEINSSSGSGGDLFRVEDDGRIVSKGQEILDQSQIVLNAQVFS